MSIFKQSIYLLPLILMMWGSACLADRIGQVKDQKSEQAIAPPLSPTALVETLTASQAVASDSGEATTAPSNDLTSTETETIGPSAAQQTLLASLDNYGPAPEIHNDIWLNSEPLRLSDLRGKVVIVGFWTFG